MLTARLIALARRLRPDAAVFTFYLLLACLITWPLVTDLSGQLIGHDTSDAYEMGHHLWWFTYALQTGEPLFYQTLLAYPDGIQGISLWANPLQFFPAWALAFVMPVAAAYNLTILLTMALNGWALWRMLRAILPMQQPSPPAHDGVKAPRHEGEGTGARATAALIGGAVSETPPASAERASMRATAALIGGAVFMAFPTFQGHLFGGHAGLLVMWPVPLLVAALFRLMQPADRRAALRRFAVAVVFFVLSPFGHTLQVIYVLLPLTGLFLLGRLWLRDWRGAGWVVAVGAVGCALLLVFLLPVFQDTFGTAAYAGEGFVEYSADLLGVVTPSFLHPVFSAWDYPRRVLGVNLIEGYSYVGLAAGLLALIAVVRWRAARWWLLLAFVAWLLSLGPLVKLYDTPLTLRLADTETYLALPWAWVYNLPGFSLARTPGRFTFTLALAVAALAGYGALAVAQRLRRWPRPARGLLTAGALAFILFEYQAAWPYPTLPADVPAPVAALADRDDIRAVMDVPWGNLLAAKDGLYLQVWHRRPLIAGQVTRRTPVSPAKLTLLEETLDPALLDAAGVDVLILHKTRADAALSDRLRAALGAPTYEDDRLALFEAPPSDGVPGLLMHLPAQRRITASAEVYLHMPQPGWYDFSATLDAPGRAFALSLNGQPIQRGHADGATPYTLPLYIDTPGYHTLTLALDPPCPARYDPALTCLALRLRGGIVAPAPADITPRAPVAFADGLTLLSAALPGAIASGEALPVRLAWEFAQPRRETDVRFVHLLDAAGAQVGGLDDAPGAQAAGSARMELLMLDTSGLPPGSYSVYTGWYTFPDLARFPVLADTPRAHDNLLYLGTVTLR